MTPETSSNPVEIPPELEKFVFAPDPFTRSDFPRGLLVREIEAFVRTRIHAAVKPISIEQVCRVVDHYDVHEVAPHLLEMIEPKGAAAADSSRPGARDRAPVIPLAARIAIIKAVALAGLAADRARAAALYKAACTEVSVDDITRCQELIGAYEVACLVLDAAPLSAKLPAAAAPLARFEASTEPGDAESRRKFGEFDVLVKRLQRAAKAVAVRRAILAVADRAQRISTLVRIYLDLPTDFKGYHIDWAARQLRRESWAPQPAEQVERTFVRALRDEVIAAVRAVLPEIGVPKKDDSVGIKRRVAALDAMSFFNEVLADSDLAYLATHGAGYVLPLAMRQIHPEP
jgi:hypothetical protein